MHVFDKSGSAEGDEAAGKGAERHVSRRAALGRGVGAAAIGVTAALAAPCPPRPPRPRDGRGPRTAGRSPGPWPGFASPPAK